MSEVRNAAGQRMQVAVRLAVHQLLIGVCVAIIWGLLDGARSVLPAVCGGGIGALLTFYAGARFLGRANDNARAVVMNFYSAMVRKFVLAFVLFAAAVKIFGYNFAPLITAFAASLAAYWFGLLWNTSKD